MASVTDPARELADLIRSLNVSHDQRSDTGLAKLFKVEAWSAEFFQIAFAISARIDELRVLTEDLPLDEDQKQEVYQALKTIGTAFSPSGFQNNFSHTLQHYLSPAPLAHLTLLSGLVRQVRSYPKLTEAEIADLLGLVDELRKWLTEHQLIDHDFIRQALLDGLAQMRFRLERFKWLGWGYTLDSLREVISAYFALEHGTPVDGSNTTAEAMVKHIQSFVRRFFETVHLGKEVAETSGFMLRAYGATQLLLHGKTTIAGLLTYMTGS